jgi:hypothetical protein
MLYACRQAACRSSVWYLVCCCMPHQQDATHPCGSSFHRAPYPQEPLWILQSSVPACMHKKHTLIFSTWCLIGTACPAHACLAPVACRVHYRHGVCLRLHARMCWTPQELTIVGCTPLLPPVPAHNSMHGLENRGRFKAKVLPAVQQGCRTTQLDSLPVKAFSGRDTQG